MFAHIFLFGGAFASGVLYGVAIERRKSWAVWIPIAAGLAFGLLSEATK